MGDRAAAALIGSLKGSTPEKETLVPIMVATHQNIDGLLPTARQTVFAEDDG